MLKTEAVVLRLRKLVSPVSSNTTALPAWNATSAPRYCQLVVTPMSHVDPFLPVQVSAVTYVTSRPTILFTVSLVKPAVTPAGSGASVNPPKPEPPRVLYLINGTSPIAGTPVRTPRV